MQTTKIKQTLLKYNSKLNKKLQKQIYVNLVQIKTIANGNIALQKLIKNKKQEMV